MPYIPITGFAPDADPTTPGVLTQCANLVPTSRGMRCGASGVATAQGALADPVRGAFLARQLNGTNRFFAATQDAIYEAGATSWADVSKVGGYTGTTTNRRRFCQYGDVTITGDGTATDSEILQFSATGAFADIAGSPKAEIVETVELFVFALNTNANTDGWHCCAKGDYTDWVENIDTESASGRLVGSPGAITAGKRLGGNMVAYKERAIFIASYIGSPQIWLWQQVAGSAGALSQEAVASITMNGAPAHIVVGPDDIWIFDGSRPVSIANGVLREWFFAQFNQAYRSKVFAVPDEANGRVFIWYPDSTSAGNANACIVYHYHTGKWGRWQSGDISWATDWAPTPKDFDSIVGTFDAQITTFDSFGVPVYYSMPGYFSTADVFNIIGGGATASSWTTGDVGTDGSITLLSRIRPRMLIGTPLGTVTNYYRDSLSDSLITDFSVPLVSGKADMLRSARWHRVAASWNGDYELLGLDWSLQEDGID